MFNLTRSSVSTLFQTQDNPQPSRIDLLKITQVKKKERKKESTVENGISVRKLI